MASEGLKHNPEYIAESNRLPHYGPAILVNKLLTTLDRQGKHISSTAFYELVSGNKEEQWQEDERAIRTAMVRTIDESGYMLNILNWSKSQDESLRLLRKAGKDQMDILSGYTPDAQEEVFDALKDLPGTTLRAIIILDELQGNAMKNFRTLREQSELAQAARTATGEAIRQLYRDPSQLKSSTYDPLVPKEHMRVFEQGIPRIYYHTKIDNEGNVDSVNRYFFYPNIWQVRLGKEFEGQDIGHMIFDITPQSYLRQKHRNLNPKTHVHDFLIRLGIVGDPLTRRIINQVNKDQEFVSRVKRYGGGEEELAERFADLERLH